MSIFASQTHSDPIPIPGTTFTAVVRKLTGREYEQAQLAAISIFQAGEIRPRGFSALMRKILNPSDPMTVADALKAYRDPLTGLDRYAVIHAGLVDSTAPGLGKVDPAVKDGTKARAAAIEDLDDEAVEFLALEIMRRTKPALFLNETEVNAR